MFIHVIQLSFDLQITNETTQFCEIYRRNKKNKLCEIKSNKARQQRYNRQLHKLLLRCSVFSEFVLLPNLQIHVDFTDYRPKQHMV